MAPATVAPLLSLALLGGCAADDSPAPPRRPDLLFVTVDTLRPDALGWVAGRGATPALDALAAAGVAFPAAVAAVPLTLPSHASMFSGLLPRRHGVRDNHQVLGVEPPLLAERLAAVGYDTAAVVSGFPLTASFGLDRGFAGYSDELTAGEGAWLERPAAQSGAEARRRLGVLRSPWFLWVHFYDPHFPYEPPVGFARPGPRGAYDGEVAYVDAEIATLVAAARRASDDLLTVFTADHGEALGEHGEGTHGFFVYDDTMLVPLVFHWPRALAPARRDEPARLIDLTPTLLDLFGLEPLAEADGVSLEPLLAGTAMALPAAYLETLQPWNSYGWSPLAAVRHEGWKLIAAPRPELYDLGADPDEAVNRFAEEPARSRRLGLLLRQIEAQPAVRSEAVADAASRERLAALGYLGSAPSPEIPPRGELEDPKDQAELRELLTEADRLLRAGEPAAAAPLLRQVLASDPDNRFARLRLAAALRATGALERARLELARAVELAPDDPEARAAHASLLSELGRPREAIAQWLEVVRLQPRRVGAWSNLAAAFGLAGEPERAVAAYERAAELEPASPERWIRLGFASFGAGRPAAAVEHLERAARMTGPDAFAHPGALGLLLARLGRSAEAIGWLERSFPGEGDFLEARLALVRLYLAAGDEAAARRLLSEGVRARPELAALARADAALAPLVAGR